MRPEGIFPLTPLQQGMLLHAEADAPSGVYISQLSIVLEGLLDRAAFERALEALAKRHEVLRLSFHRTGLEKPVQVVHPSARIPVEWRDWSSLAQAEQIQRFSELLRQDRQRGFVLEHPPLTRFTVCVLGGNRYRVLWSNHHVLFDGWSRALLIRDLAGAYQSALAARPYIAPAPPPYADFLRWLKRQNTAEAESYWRTAMSGFEEPSYIAHREAATSDDDGYDEASIELCSEETQALEEYSRSRHCTLSTIIQAAWSVLVSRFSRRHDVVFGVTSSGRLKTLPRSSEAVGLLINTLPVRVNRPLSHSMDALAAAIHNTGIEMRRHEQTALPLLRTWTSIPAPQHLFDSIVVFENYPFDFSGSDLGPGLAVCEVEPHERTNYPLTLIVEPGSRLRLRLSYRCCIFPRTGIEEILADLAALLGLGMRHPNVPIRSLPFGRGVRVSPRSTLASPRTLNEWFERSVGQWPGREAVTGEQSRLTYAELNRLANLCAWELVENGVGPERLVAVLLDRSPALIAALLGVLKAGGAYVPLDPAYPSERLRRLLEDSGATVLMTQGSPPDWVPASISAIDVDRVIGLQHSPPNPKPRLTEQSLAYVLYTSGSTGQPKGVAVTHGNVTKLLQSTKERFGFGANDCWTLFHSYAFDFSVWELFGALLHGGRLVVVPRWVSRSADEFWQLVCRERVTVLNQTPSAFWVLMATALAAGSPQAGALRLVIFGGEALDPGMLQPWVRRHGLNRTRLVNMYGITETTVHVTAQEIGEEHVYRGRGSPIGAAIDGWQVYVLDELMQPMPDGIAGEIYVGAAGVSRGYHKRAALTGERFVPDPFGEPGGRLYRSGDLGRWNAGILEYIGRCDQQVKIRGHRIEVGEVEASLMAHSGVREAVVMQRLGAQGPRLIAWVVPKPSSHFDPGQLQEHLQQRLPEFMMPAAIQILDSLPLTPNGKLDRLALPEPYAATGEEKGHAAPRTERERLIAAIYCEILGRASASVRDSFFELGGDSISAMRLLSRVNAQFGASLSIRTLYERPTIASIAAFLDRSSPADPANGIPRAERRPASAETVA